MSKDEALIKGTLDTILRYTYPDTYKKYLSYFIRVRPKELKTKHAHYIRKERMIEIFNLSRESRFLLITCLHEITHHVEYEDLDDSNHGATFYERFHQLYMTAVGLKLLEITDIADENDAGDYSGMLTYCGDLSKWKIPDIPDMKKRMVIVKDGRSIRNILKGRGYYWFTVSQTWQREMSTLEEAEREVEFLLKYSNQENLLIRPVISPTFLSYYYIAIENGYEYRYGLKELGYFWEGYGVKKMWVKKVDAQSYYAELEKLTQFADIEYKKVTPNQTEEKVEKKIKIQKKKQEEEGYIIDYYV